MLGKVREVDGVILLSHEHKEIKSPEALVLQGLRGC